MILKNNFLKVLLSLIIVITLIFVGLIIKIYSQSGIDEAQKVDALVVLGASQWNEKPSPVFKARLDHALDLYQNHYSSKIILTGGIGKREKISESKVGRNYLMQKGIDDQNIFIEEIGHTSWQSLNQVAQILKNQNLNSVILVSHGFHIMRLKKMSKDLKIQAYASPVQRSSTIKNKTAEFKYILRESLVYILYLLFKV